MIPEGSGEEANVQYSRSGDNISGQLNNVHFPVKILIIPSYHQPEEVASLLETYLGTHQNVLKFGEGIQPEDIEITRSGLDLIIKTPNEGDGVTVANWYGGQKLTKIQFADGTEWSAEEIHEKGLVVHGTEEGDTLEGLNGEADIIYGQGGADIIDGHGGSDQIFGGEGDDTLYGDSGNDVLAGGVGNDVIDGGDGDDTLEGGVGSDYLSGGYGADIYVFSQGSGQDFIYDYDTSGSKDTVVFDDNLLNIVFSRDNNDLKILSNNDTVTVNHWYSSSSYQIEEFKAANGSVLSNTKVDQLIQAMATFTQQNGVSWSQAIQERPQDVQNIVSQFWVHQSV
jgi:Ca2+-binding RTX toxin-like protein